MPEVTAVFADDRTVRIDRPDAVWFVRGVTGVHPTAVERLAVELELADAVLQGLVRDTQQTRGRAETAAAALERLFDQMSLELG